MQLVWIALESSPASVCQVHRMVGIYLCVNEKRHQKKIFHMKPGPDFSLTFLFLIPKDSNRNRDIKMREGNKLDLVKNMTGIAVCYVTDFLSGSGF